jgi:molybdate transport system ATP-binding protein
MTHVLYVKNGEIHAAGNREDVLRFAAKRNGGQDKPESLSPAEEMISQSLSKKGLQKIEPFPSEKGDILIDMRDVTVRYGDTVVLDAFIWRVRDGENWAILGENGAGKSTVLKLILGDNLQSYSNDITIFGRKKGEGVSIWEIKSRIGVVSTEFQARYRKDVPAFDVVCSGFHDSIGLYRPCSEEQKSTAMQWMQTLRIDGLAGKSFEQLSYGQRKMTLIARAMVKSPVLIFLDEPCDGLDSANRDKILKMIEYIGRHTHTNLVYVTHHETEMAPSITHRLTLFHGRVIEMQRTTLNTTRFEGAIPSVDHRLHSV